MLLPQLALSALSLVAAQEDFKPDTTFNVTYPSTWAQVDYTTGGSDAACLPSYPSLTPWANPPASELLYPRVSCPGSLSPNVQFVFPLTRVKFHGYLENASSADTLQLRVDGRIVASQPSSEPGVLVESPELLWGSHRVMLDVFGGNATLHIENITVTTGSKGEHKDSNRVDHEVIKDGKLNEQFGYTGQWNVTTVLENTNRTIGTSPSRLSTNDSNERRHRLQPSSRQPPVPPRPQHSRKHLLRASHRLPLRMGQVLDGRLLPSAALDALRRLGLRRGRAVRDPRRAVRHAPRPEGQVQRLSGRRRRSGRYAAWREPCQFLVLVSSQWKMLLERVRKRADESNETQPSPSASPSPSTSASGSPQPYHPHPEAKSNTGAIVGGVVGGVGGFLILALVGFLFYRLGKRRSQRKGGYAPQPSENGDRFEVDDSATATPYIDSMPLVAGAAGRGARPTLPPLVTETKHALDSPTNSSAHLTPGATRHSDMLLSPGGRSDSEWTNMTSHTFGPTPTNTNTNSSVPLTPLEREIKATIPPSPITPVTASSGSLGMGTFGLGPVDERPSEGAAVVGGAAGVGEGKTRSGPAPNTRRPRRVAQEEDAGRMDEDLELVPPSYNPEWARERQSGNSPTTPSDPHNSSPPQL